MTGTGQDVTSEPIDGDLPGTIYRPAGRERAPGVLALHGSGAESLDEVARRFAGAGFVGAAVQYFGDHDAVPEHLAEVPIEAVGSAVEALLGHERVAGDRVGLYGGSKGAELALVAAANVERVGAVVGVSGSCYVWEGLHRDWSPTGTSSWSIGGEPVPFVPFADEESPDGTIRGNYELALDRADPETIEAATIPVERIDAPLLFVSGGGDRMWAGAEYARTAMERLDRAAFEQPHRHLSFDDAGHVIRPPGPWLDSLDEGQLRAVGGTVEGTRRASEEAWPEVVAVLEDHLGE